MYAIIKTGGKQYRVKKGDFVDVELMQTEEGKEHLEFPEVLFVYDGQTHLVGTPFVSGWVVKGKAVSEVAGPKITSVKYKRSHNEYRKFGHKQRYSRFEIIGIEKK